MLYCCPKETTVICIAYAYRKRHKDNYRAINYTHLAWSITGFWVPYIKPTPTLEECPQLVD